MNFLVSKLNITASNHCTPVCICIINSMCNQTRSYLCKNCSIQSLIIGHFHKLWEMSAERQHGYPRQLTKLQVASPHIPSTYQANCTLCKFPIQFLGSNTKEHYLAIISSGPNTCDTETGFSRCSRAHCTFSSMVPPLSRISMMCAFFWHFFSSFI